jgi:hypothetical protein
MLVTTKDKVIIDIICDKTYARCLLRKRQGWKIIPYSDVKWVSKDWYFKDIKRSIK